MPALFCLGATGAKSLAFVKHTTIIFLSAHLELGRHIIGAQGSRICTICSWEETSEVLFHGLQAAGSEPTAAKVDEELLLSRSASSARLLHCSRGLMASSGGPEIWWWAPWWAAAVGAVAALSPRAVAVGRGWVSNSSPSAAVA